MAWDDEGAYEGGNPLGDGEVTVTAKAPSWLRRSGAPPVTGADAALINKVRRRDDYGGLSRFALGAVMAPVAALAAPAVSKAASAYSAYVAAHPGVAAALTLGNTGLSAYSLASRDGLRKTAGLAREGRLGDAAWSALGDAVDVAGIGGAAVKAVKSIPFRWYSAWLRNARDHTRMAARDSWLGLKGDLPVITSQMRRVNANSVKPLALRLRYKGDIIRDALGTHWSNTKYNFQKKYRPWLDIRSALTEPFIDRRWALRQTPMSAPWFRAVEAGNTYNDAQGLLEDLRPLSPWGGGGGPLPSSSLPW